MPDIDDGLASYMRNLLSINPSPEVRASAAKVVRDMTGRELDEFLADHLAPTRVLVDPSDPATVEAAAKALAAEYYAHYDGAPAYDDVLARYFTRLAAAVLAAIATPTDETEK